MKNKLIVSLKKPGMMRLLLDAVSQHSYLNFFLNTIVKATKLSDDNKKSTDDFNGFRLAIAEKLAATPTFKAPYQRFVELLVANPSITEEKFVEKFLNNDLQDANHSTAINDFVAYLIKELPKLESLAAAWEYIVDDLINKISTQLQKPNLIALLINILCSPTQAFKNWLAEPKNIKYKQVLNDFISHLEKHIKSCKTEQELQCYNAAYADFYESLLQYPATELFVANYLRGAYFSSSVYQCRMLEAFNKSLTKLDNLLSDWTTYTLELEELAKRDKEEIQKAAATKSTKWFLPLCVLDKISLSKSTTEIKDETDKENKATQPVVTLETTHNSDFHIHSDDSLRSLYLYFQESSTILSAPKKEQLGVIIEISDGLPTCALIIPKADLDKADLGIIYAEYPTSDPHIGDVIARRRALQSEEQQDQDNDTILNHFLAMKQKLKNKFTNDSIIIHSGEYTLSIPQYVILKLCNYLGAENLSIKNIIKNLGQPQFIQKNKQGEPVDIEIFHLNKSIKIPHKDYGKIVESCGGNPSLELIYNKYREGSALQPTSRHNLKLC